MYYTFSSGLAYKYVLPVGYLHTEYDPEKMSKSLKNTISVKDLLDSHSANQFRMFCMLTNYRSRKFSDYLALSLYIYIIVL